MMRLAAVAFFVLGLVPAYAQQFGPAQFPVRADDGELMTNHTLTGEQLAKLHALTGVVPVGDLKGDVTLMQWYDLNCPFCREAAADIDALLKADKKLKLVFVPYAVLSVQSVQGALIELGAAKILTPEKYVDFHRNIYTQRGTIDGPKTANAVRLTGGDPAEAAKLGNTEETLNLLRTNATFGGDIKMVGTPAYVINDVVIVGHPGLKGLQNVIAAVRKCGKVAC
ncbi:MAG: DsbA family protein [Pseudolabrys sp.]|nr:DsbA family protein [Pseudolabrys sp.]